MEKNNYNFNENPRELSSDDISKHMDFDALMGQFDAADAREASVNVEPKPKKGRIRRLWKTVSAAAAVLIGAAVFFFFGREGKINSTQKSDAYFAAQEYVNPPIEEAQEAFSEYTVEDAYQGGVYKYKSGSKLVIPPKAFTSRSGEIVSGKVDIKYREYHDYVDFFVSGIPMRYDSAGVEYILESAGMIEIYGEKNGERVEISS